MLFRQTIQNVNRARDIALILIKYGFEEVVAQTSLRGLISNMSLYNRHKDRKKGEFNGRSREERIRMAIEELGPTYIKLAQILSNRSDVVTKDLIVEFEKLQSDVKPIPFEVVQKIIEKETHFRTDVTFGTLDEKPIGAASIGQVHHATLRSGRQVVVKVQRPNVIEMVRTDISILKEVIKLSEAYFKRQGILNPIDIVEAFEKTMQRELDYSMEARNMEQFAKYYKEDKRFHVPKVFKSLSTSKVLVMEYINGCKITDVRQMKAWGINPHTIAEKGLDIYLTQMFEHGFFHADPHPGNIIIQPSGKICLIDFGMVGRLTNRDRFELAGVFIGMAQQDRRRMARSLVNLSLDARIPNIRALEMDLGEVIEDFTFLDVGESNVSELANSLQKIIYKYQLKVPPTIFIILRALAILEGIGKTIYPNFKFYEFLRPYGVKIFKEQYSIGNISSNAVSLSQQFFDFISNLPYEANEIMSQLAKGRFHVQLEHEGYDNFIKKKEAISNRMILAFLVATIYIASAIVLYAPAGSTWANSAGISYLSIAGMIFGTLLLMILLISMIRNGRL